MLHYLHHHSVQLIDRLCIRNWGHFKWKRFKWFAIRADHRAHGTQWCTKAAVRQAVIELSHFEWRHIERAQQ